MAYTQGLTDREAIVDVLYQSLEGIDTNNVDLFMSTFVNNDEAAFIRDGQAIKGRDNLKDLFTARVGPLDTHHLVTNPRVAYQPGSSTARMTANGQNQHHEAGEGKVADSNYFLAGVRYTLDMEKDTADQTWKIKTWDMKVQWMKGDLSIVMPS